ncbi:MAG: class II glutamine amidotransferase [Candidatus Heimdallarchaeaceae archaeon]
MCRLFLKIGQNLEKRVFLEFILSCEDYVKGPKLDIHERNKNQTFPHPDGFGYSVLKNDSFSTFHFLEPIFSTSVNIYSEVKKGDIALLHARKASPGIEINIKNNHPFEQEFLGKKWVFMHNGTIKKEIIFDKNKFNPKGTTDSEKYFFKLLELIEKNGSLSSKAVCNLIKEWDYSGANFILANNEKVWVGVFFKKYPLYYTMKLYNSDSTIIVSSCYLPSLGEAKLLKNNSLIEIDIREKQIFQK